MSALGVLLLDDDETTREVLAHQLRDLGVGRVRLAADGQQGLMMLDPETARPNLLICDLAMPGMDGIEFLRHVAGRGYAGAVVLLSGASATILLAAQRLAREHGLDILGTLEKPVEPDALSAVLSLGCRKRPPRPPRAELPVLGERELRDGLAEGHVEVDYQPKMNLLSQRVVGVECLARWRHPEHGLLPPAAFIPLIEELGLVDPFTLEVFRQAVGQQRIWLDWGRKLKLNINVSMDNLLRVDLPERLESLAHSAGILPQGIMLEMTESRLMRDLKLSLDVLIRLRLKGFGLSIDDFGTDYSTMEALKQLPFSELKIDRGFVHGAEHDATARAILESSARLGRMLGMNVVAEGVETQCDWDVVVEAGCDEVQGYFVARPLPAEELWTWLAGRQDATQVKGMTR